MDKINIEVYDKVKAILEELLPLVNLESDFLFAELDSIDIINTLLVLSDRFDIKMNRLDVTPKNFRSITSITQLVESKIGK